MKNALKIINELKKNGLITDYAIGGAIGVLKWVEPFFTRDLDIFIISAKSTRNENIIEFSSIYNYLKKKGYNKWVGQWIILGGIPVEFIPAIGISEEAVKYARKMDYEGIKTKIMTPEYLIALLLTVGRDKDRIKIRMLLDQAEIDKKKLETILGRYNLSGRYKDFVKKEKGE